ncbi:MAG: nucleoside-diphosphate sugar epimerase/dehydratase, partial [bacterium]
VYCKMYQNIWKYIKNFICVLKSIIISFIIIILLMYFSNSYFFSKSVLFFNTIILFLFLLGIRLIARFIYSKKFSKPNCQNILIAGIDEKAKQLLQNFNQFSNIIYNPIGFIDEDTRKIGKVIEGIKVLGTWNDIPDIVAIQNVKEIFISSKIPVPEIKTIIEFCKKAKINYKIIPCVKDLLSNKIIHLSEVRNIEILDILERESINLDFLSISNFLKGKKVLVTGAGGSIGSELCKQIYSNYNAKSLTLVDKTENYLYEIECELENIKSSCKYFSYLCDITHKNKLKTIFEHSKPDIIFHTAAYKHVPLSEKNFIETIENNIFGTKIIADLTNEFGINCFTMISTDKAVNPTSIMGATKRIAEIYIQNLSQKSNTKYLTVRFGNVLNSKGSVIPLFQKQIEKGGPITITHPEMERYFMTISESVQLILQSATLGQKKEIFILDMGKPIKIIDLCKEMIKLSGYNLEKFQIKFIGLRPGEKLSEKLFEQEEKILPCSHPNIKILKPIHFSNDIEKDLIELQQLIQSNPSFNQIAIKLQKIIPSYKSNFFANIEPTI